MERRDGGDDFVPHDRRDEEKPVGAGGDEEAEGPAKQMSGDVLRLLYQRRPLEVSVSERQERAGAVDDAFQDI